MRFLRSCARLLHFCAVAQVCAAIAARILWHIVFLHFYEERSAHSAGNASGSLKLQNYTKKADNPRGFTPENEQRAER